MCAGKHWNFGNICFRTFESLRSSEVSKCIHVSRHLVVPMSSSLVFHWLSNALFVNMTRKMTATKLGRENRSTKTHDPRPTGGIRIN